MGSRGVLRFLRREEEHGFIPSQSWSVKHFIQLVKIFIKIVKTGGSLCFSLDFCGVSPPDSRETGYNNVLFKYW